MPRSSAFPGAHIPRTGRFLKTGNRIKWCFHCFCDSYSAAAETPTNHLCLRQSLGSPRLPLHGLVSPTFLGLLPISQSRHLASLKVICSLSFVKPVGRNPQTCLSPQESLQPPPLCVQGWGWEWEFWLLLRLTIFHTFVSCLNFLLGLCGFMALGFAYLFPLETGFLLSCW